MFSDTKLVSEVTCGYKHQIDKTWKAKPSLNGLLRLGMFKAVLLKRGRGASSSSRVTGELAGSAQFLDPMPDLLSQKLWGWHPAIRIVLTSSPGDSAAHSSSRTTSFLSAVSLHLPLSRPVKSCLTFQGHLVKPRRCWWKILPASRTSSGWVRCLSWAVTEHPARVLTRQWWNQLRFNCPSDCPPPLAPAVS